MFSICRRRLILTTMKCYFKELLIKLNVKRLSLLIFHRTQLLLLVVLNLPGGQKFFRSNLKSLIVCIVPRKRIKSNGIGGQIKTPVSIWTVRAIKMLWIIKYIRTHWCLYLMPWRIGLSKSLHLLFRTKFVKQQTNWCKIIFSTKRFIFDVLDDIQS